jgi:hypothetical protein
MVGPAEKPNTVEKEVFPPAQLSTASVPLADSGRQPTTVA